MRIFSTKELLTTFFYVPILFSCHLKALARRILSAGVSLPGANTADPMALDRNPAASVVIAENSIWKR
jgi:hypothetical protein